MIFILITLEGCTFCHKARSELFTHFNFSDRNTTLQHFDQGHVRFIIYHIQRNDIPRIHDIYGKHTFPICLIHDRKKMHYLGGSETITDLIRLDHNNS